MTAQLFFFPGRIEARQADPAVYAGGRKLGHAEDVGVGWRVEPDLTSGHVLDARDALEAELILRDTWRLT